MSKTHVENICFLNRAHNVYTIHNLKVEIKSFILQERRDLQFVSSQVMVEKLILRNLSLRKSTVLMCSLPRDLLFR